MKRRILALLAAGCLVTGLAGAAAVQAEESAEEAVETVSGAESTDSEAEEETVSKDVAFGPKNLGLDEEEQAARVKKAIGLVGLDYEEIKDLSPFELSGGQKRRVAIAGVIAMDPKILILDEPTAGLDPSAHRDILAMVRRIHDEMGIILIFVSHNMADIAEMSDRVMVMSEGKVALEGTPAEVFSHADELAEMGLDVPPARRMTELIKSKAPGFRSEALTIDEAAGDIRKYLEETRG